MLQDISVPDALALRHPSRDVVRLIDEANRRIERFTRTHRPRIDNFVVCDFPLVDSALQWIAEQNLLCGESFCEWGSGFGVVTLMAALHGLDACGIEVEQALVAQSQQLADDFEIRASFAQGSFIPDDGHDRLEFHDDTDHLDIHSASGYDELGRDIADFDLFFAFPWPGEQRFWETIFDQFACDGALLLMYQGIEPMRLQRHLS